MASIGAGLAEGVFQADLLLIEILDRELAYGSEEERLVALVVGKFDIHDGNYCDIIILKLFLQNH